MPLLIDDATPAAAGPGAAEARLELALWLRAQDQLQWRRAADFAGVSPGAFLDALEARGVPLVHAGGTTEAEAPEYLRQDAVLSRGLRPDGTMVPLPEFAPAGRDDGPAEADGTAIARGAAVVAGAAR